MAYDPLNSPICTFSPSQNIAQAANKSGKQVWQYDSADALTTVQGSGYFSNGVELGMRVGDIVDVSVAGALKTPRQYVSAVTATAATISASATS